MHDDLLTADNHFSTHDITLAAALAMFYPVVAVDRNDPRSMRFLFRCGVVPDEVIEHYLCGELTVEPRAYAEQLHRLEAMGNRNIA